jgi:signal transduction histidine kinase
MFERRSLKLPITLGVMMIVVLVALIVGWVLLTVSSIFQSPQSPLYWTLLTVGSLLFVLVLVGVVLYLRLSIKAINLNRRQSNFIDSVTHELKSPIASLKLYLQTLNMRTVTEKERTQFHKFMMDDVERLDGLISHLLDAGTLDKRGNEKQKEPINLAELIRDCVTMVCSRYRSPESTVELTLIPCEILAPPVDAVMMFRNLIDNAVKYAGSPPKVHVTMHMEGEFVVTEVTDNGAGIPQNQHRKIFRRFERLGKELQREKPGTGLGLYIVRTLAKQLGGNVQVLNRDKRMGTVFELRLPGKTIEMD